MARRGRERLLSALRRRARTLLRCAWLTWLTKRATKRAKLPTNNKQTLPQPDYLADQKGVPRDQVASWTPYPGGAPANVATALARLGVPTAFTAALGDDEMGDRMVALLAGEEKAAAAFFLLPCFL